MELNREYQKVLENISEQEVKGYVKNNLKSSLKSINFSEEFVNYIFENFSNLDFKDFYELYEKELEETYDKGFFQKIVPSFFRKEVIPSIPISKRVLDVGCGTGILIKELSKDNKFELLKGIDINSYPEWKYFENEKINFEVVLEKDFESFLNSFKPDCVLLTWVLHHMEFSEQERYLKMIYSKLNEGTKLIILEDSYSEKIPPEVGIDIHNSFIEFNKEDKKKIMSTYDFFANRLLARRTKVPIPCTYRTLEEWEELTKKTGYKIVKKRFIGFPNKRDINTPQSLIVLER